MNGPRVPWDNRMKRKLHPRSRGGPPKGIRANGHPGNKRDK